MRPQVLNTLSESIRRRDVYLIQQQEAPFPTLQEFHKLFRGMGSGTRVGDHAVYGDDDSGCAVFGASELQCGPLVTV